MAEDKKALMTEQLEEVTGGVDVISGKDKKNVGFIADKTTTIATVLDDADKKSKIIFKDK